MIEWIQRDMDMHWIETMIDNTKYWLTTCAFASMVSDLSKNGSLIWHGKRVCVYLYRRE